MLEIDEIIDYCIKSVADFRITKILVTIIFDVVNIGALHWIDMMGTQVTYNL